MLKLSRVAPNEWEFVYPRIYYYLMDEFHVGCELYEEMDLDKAERVFKGILVQMPDHLDAIHHLALVISERDLTEQARDLWFQAVSIGRKAFPQEFQLGNDRLEWGWLENRPFLRCLHGLALARHENYEVEEALRLFRELLSLNPNDNQGVRALAVTALFELGRLEDVLKLTERYRDDILPEVLYGRALALFKLGRRRQANVALKKAIEELPLVRKELLKKRHRLPRTAKRDSIIVGGVDQAYHYWKHAGRFWEEDPKATEWLRGTAGPAEVHQAESQG